MTYRRVPPSTNPIVLGQLVREGDVRTIEYLVDVLKRNDGDVGKTALELNVARRTLYKWQALNEELRAGFEEHAEGRTFRPATEARSRAAKAKKKGKKP